jgi:signal transduction histidine kinase
MMSAASSQLRAVGTAFLLKRPLIVAPGAALATLLLTLAGVPRPQLLALCACLAVMFSFFCVEAWYGRKRDVSERWLNRSLRITVTGLCVACALSGGLRSPFLPLTLAPVVVAFAAFGRSRATTVMAGYFAVLVAALALVPGGRPWPSIPSPFDVGMTAGTTMITLALAYVGVAQLSDALVRSRESLLRMREDALASATERLRSLETIGSKVAHELKNPLASIKGLAQLSAASDDERTKRRFAVLLAAARRMEEVLEDYLSFNRPLDELHEEVLDVDRLVDDAIELVEIRAHRAGVRLRRHGHAGELRGDRRRLLDAVLNVLTNAVEASPDGEDVRVDLHRNASSVRITIADQGEGISAANLERVGSPYFTTKPHGTGLGVVIATAALRQHGGDLSFDSERGRGTRATLELPLPPTEEQGDATCTGRR